MVWLKPKTTRNQYTHFKVSETLDNTTQSHSFKCSLLVNFIYKNQLSSQLEDHRLVPTCPSFICIPVPLYVEALSFYDLKLCPSFRCIWTLRVAYMGNLCFGKCACFTLQSVGRTNHKFPHGMCKRTRNQLYLHIMYYSMVNDITDIAHALGNTQLNAYSMRTRVYYALFIKYARTHIMHYYK